MREVGRGNANGMEERSLTTRASANRTFSLQTTVQYSY